MATVDVQRPSMAAINNIRPQSIDGGWSQSGRSHSPQSHSEKSDGFGQTYSHGYNADPEKGEIVHLNPDDKLYEPVVELKEIQKIVREGITLGGGLTAILLQVAHPTVGRGVSNHSEFKTRALDRAEKTGIYIYVMVFGKQFEKDAFRGYVNKMHAMVKGGEGKDAYYAKDPHAQLWVAATIYATMIGMYETVFGPLPPAKAERVYKEFSYLGTSLQMPPELWPKSRAAFWEYYRDMVENHLRVTPEARIVLNDLMHPAKSVPLLLRPAVPLLMPFVKALAIEQLPLKTRTDFGLKSTKFTRFTNSLFTATMMATYPAMPLFIRQFPKTFYMRRVRNMLKKRGITEASPEWK